jgi:hypothetical protein
MYPKPVSQSANIASGGTTSQALRVGGKFIVGLITPAALTGTTITFTGCDTATGTFVPIYDSDGTAVSVAVAASRGYGLSGAEADALAPFPYIKLVSGSAEGAARVVKLLTK